MAVHGTAGGHCLNLDLEKLQAANCRQYICVMHMQAYNN